MAGTFSVSITAVDGATKTIDKINKRLKAFSAPYDKLSKSIATFGDVSGLTRVGRAFGDIGRAGLSAFQSITRIVEPLAAITGAASIAGMYALVSAWASWGSKLGYDAERVGMSADRLLDWQNAARLAGVSGDAASGGIRHLKDAMTNALGGRDNDAMSAFMQMGLSIKQLHGTADSVLPQIIKRIGELEKTNPTLAARLTTAMTGSEDLLRLFRKGMPAVQAYLDQAHKLGGVTDDQVARGDRLRQSQEALSQATENFGRTLASSLEPVVRPVLDFMSAWIVANQKWISADITSAVGEFVDYIKAIDWMAVARHLDVWYRRIHSVIDALGGIKSVLRDIMFLAVGGFALKLAAPFFALAGALDSVGLKMGRAVLAMRTAQKAAAVAAAGEAATAAAGTAAAPVAGAAGGALTAGGAALAGTAAGLGAAAIATAALAALAYILPHGMSWLLGQGWNDEHASNTGPGPNSANRGHDRNATGGKAGPGLQKGIAIVPGAVLADTGATAAQYAAFKLSVAKIEHARYDQMGGANNAYAGRYQMGRDEIAETARRLGEATPSQAAFLHDPKMQERYMDAYTQAHNAFLMRNSAKYRDETPGQRLATLGYAHNQGAGGAANWLDNGIAGRDAFGTSGADYADAINRAELGVGAGAPAAGAPAAAAASSPNAAGAPGAAGTVTVEVKADPALKARVAATKGDVKAAPPGVVTTAMAWTDST